MRELNADGTMQNVEKLLQEQGFNVGDHVSRKAGNVRGKILEIVSDEVKVQMEETPDVVAKFSLASFLQNQWTHYKPKVHIGDVILTVLPSICPQFKSSSMSSAIHHAISTLTLQHQDVLKHLKIQLKPKAVVATKSFEKGKLVLVPSSFRVSHSNDRPSRQVLHITVPGYDGFFWPAPMMFLPKDDAAGLVVPFWHVQTASDDIHNMEICWLKVDNGSFKVPVLKNIEGVRTGDVLVRARIDDDSAATRSEPPTKKSTREPPTKTSEPKTRKSDPSTTKSEPQPPTKKSR